MMKKKTLLGFNSRIPVRFKTDHKVLLIYYILAPRPRVHLLQLGYTTSRGRESVLRSRAKGRFLLYLSRGKKYFHIEVHQNRISGWTIHSVGKYSERKRTLISKQTKSLICLFFNVLLLTWWVCMWRNIWKSLSLTEYTVIL